MYAIGIDLGGTNIVAGVVDDNYNLLSLAKCKTVSSRSAEEIIDDMAAMAREATEKAGLLLRDIAHIGVGCPGTCNPYTGEVEYANNLPFSHIALGPILKEKLGLPVYIENDANAAAIGEMKAGAAKGAESCVCITLGTGVGGGVIIDGKVFSGFNFSGTELGHTVIVANGEACTCGRNGCWEAYASATALINQTRRAMEDHPESKMWEIAESLDKVNGLTAFDAMRAGDAVGKAVVDAYIGYVGCGLTNMVNIFQPEVLCIGGGICKEGETLLAPLRAIVERERYSKYSEKQTRLCVAELGNDAGVIGAAALGR
ncbi:MAG: ROK family protein [Clostridia bacterium]|nr:ROK family protein [Clostridia bacterium]